MSKNVNSRWCWLFAVISLDALGQSITIDSGWIRLLPQNLRSTAAYIEITNPSEEVVEILRVQSSVASTGEIHRSFFEDGLMHMEKLNALQIAPKSSISMSANGIHIMLIELQVNLRHGQSHELCLVLTEGGPVCEVLQVLKSAPLSHEKSHDH